MIVCPWCASKYERSQEKCEACGGDLPLPPGEDPGVRPPPPPRQVPPRFRQRILLTRNVHVIVGIVFALIGALFTVLFPVVGTATGAAKDLWTGVVFGFLFFVLGIALFAVGYRRGKATLRAFEHGLAVVGKITNVTVDTSVRLNHRSPWAIEYAFEVRGESYSGKAHAWDAVTADRRPGQPVHVLYLADDPEQSTIYPPVR